MHKHCPRNERIKREYFEFLREAKGHGDATVDAAAKAIHQFEEYTQHRDFKGFRFEQAVGFKKQFAERKGIKSGERLSKATIYATVQALKRFFQWLATQPGYKSSVQYSEAEYFNLSEKETRIATTRREKAIPTINQIQHVLQTMPTTNEIDRRNRALVAFALLTGARDSAIASMKLKHLNLREGFVYQDAREVHTKFSKTFTTYFFPAGETVLSIVHEWIDYLESERLWGNEDPVFPATRVSQGLDRQFKGSGLKRNHWSSASSIQSVFRQAFTNAGLPYFNPHTFRNTLARLGEECCRSPEDFKAWSQNLGHEQVLTTFTSYGTVSRDRQGQILRSLGMQEKAICSTNAELIEGIFQRFKRES